MNPRRLAAGALCFAILPLSATPSAVGSGQVRSLDLAHEPLSCVPLGEHPLVSASITEAGATELRSARVYFKLADATDWYYVEMIPDALGVYEAILPKPLETTDRFEYYLAALSAGFDTAQTVEQTVNVNEDGCPDGTRSLVSVTTGIALRGTAAGQTPIPVGFGSDGIGSFVSSAGQVVSGSSLTVASSAAGAGGGGISGATIGLIAGAAGAAGVGIAVASGGDDAPSATNNRPAAIAATTTSVASTTTTTSVPPTTTTTTATMPASIEGTWDIQQTINTSCEPSEVGMSTTTRTRVIESGSDVTAELDGPLVFGTLNGTVETSNFNLEGGVVDSGFGADLRITGSFRNDSMSGNYREVFSDDGCVVTGRFTGNRR